MKEAQKAIYKEGSDRVHDSPPVKNDDRRDIKPKKFSLHNLLFAVQKHFVKIAFIVVLIWGFGGQLLLEAQLRLATFTLAEYQQAKRQSEDPKALKAMFQECWASSDNRQSFTQALEDRGFYLATGDQRGFVALDFQGEVYSLSRWVGVRAKELEARLGDCATLPKVSETKENLAKRMTKTLETHQNTIRQQIKNEAAPLLRERITMQQKHREERERMKEFHNKRQAAENRTRTERLSKGLKGLWHRMTGKYQRMREENEKQLQKSKERDSTEKRMMIDTQLKERRQLQAVLVAVRQEHKSTLTALREDTAYYMRLGRDATSSPRAEFQKAEGRTQSRSTDKGRGREIE